LNEFRQPRTNMRSPTAMWDFCSLSPESLHQATILMSDRGVPTDVRHINGQPHLQLHRRRERAVWTRTICKPAICRRDG